MEYGQILGYPLSDYNPGVRDKQQFISPLAFECSVCRTVTEVIDTDRHGYHAMLGKSAVMRGKGPRQAFRCPHCAKEEFSLIVTFIYWQGAFQAMPGEPAEKMKDYFNGFQAHGFCVMCHEKTFIAGFDL